MDGTRPIERLIAPSELMRGLAHPCSYLPGRSAASDCFVTTQLTPGTYQALMDRNFRRSGSIIYRPACDGCRECQAIRVPVAAFEPSRSQRRCLRRNRDVAVEVGPPVPTPEKHQLYRNYLWHRHDRETGGSWPEFCASLYSSPVHTVELAYRLAGRVVAVGIVDVEPQSVSTVYCYFDPESPERALGVFNVLWTIDWCRRERKPYVYLGYFIRECKKMNYKANYQPCELLGPDGQWRRTQSSAPHSTSNPTGSQPLAGG